MKKNVVLLMLLTVLVMVCSPSFAIKIGISTNVERTNVGASTDANVIDLNKGNSLYQIKGMKSYEFRAYKNNISIKLGKDYFNLKTNFIQIRPEATGYVNIENNWYRGAILIKNYSGKLYVINKVELEDYLKGVVPSEMPSSWPIEAHKAQAIAARSYALANLGKRNAYGYDLKDTPEDQAYRGAKAETLKTNKAVNETQGLVLTYDLKIIPAYYSASAGGNTINSGNVWNTDMPYLNSVPSFDENIKKNGHGVGMSQHGANNLAQKGYNAYQILHHFYKDVRFARINPQYYKESW